MHTYTTDMYEGMLAETVTITGHGGDSLHAYLARPLGPGPFPGVVMFHHIPGWDEFNREMARRFAQHGYVAICPNLYEREGHGTPEDVAAAVRAAGGVSDAQALGDAEAARRYLAGLPYSNGKAGVIGTCSGGRQTYLAACSSTSFDAAVDCWGGRVVMAPEDLNQKMPVSPIDLTADLSCPLLGLFGEEDRNPTPEHVALMETALKEHGKSYEFHNYPGAGHGFFYHHTVSYRPEAAMDGWQRIFEFFGKHLS